MSGKFFFLVPYQKNHSVKSSQSASHIACIFDQMYLSMESNDFMDCFYLGRLSEKVSIQSNISHNLAGHAQVFPKLYMSSDSI